MTVTARDQLAARVQELFKLDETQQKAALESLTVYADKPSQESFAHMTKKNGGNERVFDARLPSTNSGTDSRGAMLNAQGSFATYDVPTEPMKVMFGGMQTATPSPTLPLPSQAPVGAPLHKVVQELGNNLPKGVTTILQDLLAVAESWDSKSVGQQQLPRARGHTSKAPDGKIAAVRLLMQQLEKDQEASVRKLHNMMGSPCSRNNGVGMNVPLNPSNTFSLYGRGARDAQPEQSPSFVGAMQHPSLSGGMHMGDSSPLVGTMLFPTVQGGQQLAAEAGDRVGQSMQECLGQNPRRCVIDHPQTSVSVGTGWQQATLRMHLRSLINIDSGRVLIVRKINRLGFASQAVLHEHFSWYGVVERVLVAHSRVKSTSAADKSASPVSSRLRPSGLGFIVMSRAADAQAILANGSEQPVNGIMVRLQQFQRQLTSQEEDDNEDECETAVPETNPSEENCSSSRNSSSCEDSHQG